MRIAIRSTKSGKLSGIPLKTPYDEYGTNEQRVRFMTDNILPYVGSGLKGEEIEAETHYENGKLTYIDAKS